MSGRSPTAFRIVRRSIVGPCQPVPAGYPPDALNRKNALFAGSDGGAEHWATVASLIETCKLNDIDPLAYLTDVFTRIVNGHPTAISISCCRGHIERKNSKPWPKNSAYGWSLGCLGSDATLRGPRLTARCPEGCLLVLAGSLIRNGSRFTTVQTSSKILSVGQCSCVTGDTPNDYAASDVGGCVARLGAKYPNDDFVILATPFPAPTRPLGYVRPQHFRTRQRAPARGLFACRVGTRPDPSVCL